MISLLIRLKDFTVKLLNSLWFYFPGLLFLVAGYLVMNTLTQGRDVIVQATQHILSGGVMVLAVTFWAYVSWYSSRLLTYQRQRVKPDSPIFDQLPRVMGYACFVIPQVAIVNLDIVNKGWLTWPLVVVAILLYIFITRFAPKGISGTDTWMTIIVLSISLLGSLFNFLIVNHTDPENVITETGTFLMILVLLYILQAALFLYFNVTRRERLKKLGAVNKDEDFKAGPVQFKLAMAEGEKRTFQLFNLISLVGMIVYFLSILVLPFARGASSFTIVFIAFGVLLGAANLISYFSLRLGLNLHVIVIALAVIFNAFLPDPYDVDLLALEQGQTNGYSQRMGLEEYTYEWIKARKEVLLDDSLEEYPMIFVMADGGASRSGYWTAACLGALQDATPHFKDHLFMLSGASGGSVGNSTFFSLLHNEQAPANYEKEAKAFMQNDFLAFTASHMLGPDYFRHVFPFNFFDMRNRASTLEYGMENPETGEALFKKRMSGLLTKDESKADMPILAINTTRMNDSKPGVISTVKLDPAFTPRIDVLGKMKEDTDLYLSTAAVMGARFPYVSPAGDLVDFNYFVDGGYFDNSGAGVVHESMQAMNFYLSDSIPGLSRADLGKIKSHLKFYVIHLMNSPQREDEMNKVAPLENDLATPVITLMGSYGQQTNVNNQRLFNYLDYELYPNTYNKSFPQRHWIDVNLYAAAPEDENISMNWVISRFDLAKMNVLLERNQQLESVKSWLKGFDK